jgi:hypothetical protein
MLGQIARRIVCIVMFVVGLKGVLVPPSATFEKMPPSPSIVVPAQPPAAPLIATLDETAKPAKPVKSCPCSDQCTCGCNDGQPCKCSQKTAQAVVRQPAQVRSQPAPQSQRDWRIGGREWTRESLLAHLYGQDGRSIHSPAPLGSLDHLPLEALQAMHNADHESQTSRRVTSRQPVWTVSAPVFQTRSVRSCPTGTCPLQ